MINKLSIQFLILIFFLIPTLQFTGFIFINVKVLAFFGIILFIFGYKFMYKSIKMQKKDVLLFSTASAYVVIHITYSIMVDNVIGNMYLYIKLLSGFALYFLIIYSNETINSKIWFRLIVISITIAFLQQIPYTRDIFMLLYGSVQGYLSSFPYSRASGLSVGFYVYTQIIMLMFLIYKLSMINTILSKKLSLFVFFGSLLSNTRSTFLLPFYYLFIELKVIFKVLIGLLVFIILFYLIENFAPIKTIYHHLFLAYESGNIEPILNSQNSSFSHRIADIFWFLDLLENYFYEILFFGMGAETASGQEIGYFLIFTKVGVLLSLIFYFFPLFIVFYYLKFKNAMRYLVLILPILLADLLVSGFVKYDLYILYWVFTAFYIKYDKENKS